jgi:hypothetical protein
LAFVLTLILFFGCSAQQQSSQEPETKPPVSSAPKVSDSIKLPDSRHPDQAILAIFMVGSTQALVNGRQITMNAPAASHNYRPFVPAEYLALAVGLTSPEIRPEGRHLFIAGKVVDTLDPTYTNDTGVVCINVRAVTDALGYDLLWDRISGRIEILQRLPLSDDDLYLGEIRPDMSLGQVKDVLGPPNSETKSSMDYPGLHLMSFGNGKIYWVDCRSAEYVTRRGVKVGDSLNLVLQRFGRGYFHDYPESYFYFFQDNIAAPKRGRHISFIVDNKNTVERIITNDYGEEGFPPPVRN